MKHRLLMTIFGVTFAAVAATATAKASEPIDLQFATVGVGSAWYNYGAGIAELVLPNLPQGSNIDILPVAGGVGNIRLIESGEAELGFTHINIVSDACRGGEVFETTQENVRAVIGGLDIFYFGTFVTVRSDIESWEEIAEAKNGFRLLNVPVGGVGELGTRQVLELLDSSYEDIEAKGGTVRQMDRAGTASAIADGRADGWAHVVTRGQPAATELTTSNDMKVLPLPDHVVEGMSERFGWAPGTLPANTFRGQPEDVQTVISPTVLIANADVSEEAIYQVTKAIVENAERLHTIHAGLADFNLDNAINPQFVGNCPWHAGAERYFREAGMIQ